MAGLKKKTRKALIKPVTKLVQKHGAEAAIALVTGLIGGLASSSVAGGEKKKASPAKRRKKVEAAQASS